MRYATLRSVSAATGDQVPKTRKARLIAFYGLNGRRLTLTNEAAYDLVINVASGPLDTADDIAAVLQAATEPRN